MSTLEIITIGLMALFGLVGFISGFVKKIGGITAVIAGLVVAFFVASPLNNWFAGTSFYTNTVLPDWFNGNESTAGIVSLIALWLIVFMVVYIFIRLIFKAIKSLVEKSAALGFVDRILGLALGAAFGLVLGVVILLVVSFIAGLSSGLQDWLANDIAKGFGLITWMNNTLVPFIKDSIPTI